MTSMILVSPELQTAAITGVRWIDMAAVAAMAVVWIGAALMFFAIYKVLRSKARGEPGWGDSPGL